jgi:hypothetical protein
MGTVEPSQLHREGLARGGACSRRRRHNNQAHCKDENGQARQ